ncbi:hypothetical protein DL93DRAFT_2232048 [Clavulina sp. PMI_390]|nr:hypothetical protein DL93DRAFT_2232048 [Clavulina sp. PMI_390]
MSSDPNPNVATQAVTGVLKILHGSGEAVRGHINAFVDAAGEKLAGRKDSTPLSASGERGVDVAKKGTEEFREGLEALSLGKKRTARSLSSFMPKRSGSTSSAASGSTMPKKGRFSSMSTRRVPPPLSSAGEGSGSTLGAKEGYDPDAKQLDVDELGFKATTTDPERASLAESDATTESTRGRYMSTDEHAHHGEEVESPATITSPPPLPARANP